MAMAPGLAKSHRCRNPSHQVHSFPDDALGRMLQTASFNLACSRRKHPRTQISPSQPPSMPDSTPVLISKIHFYLRTRYQSTHFFIL